MANQYEINKPWGVSPDWKQDVREAVRRANERKLLQNTREFARQAVKKHEEREKAAEIVVETVQ